ncbi:DUF4266 domain-containing protein [Aliikangiella coralliicola]|uniref:DUF4266 domain-containing protein n=1 Tax=Aliikangiella coralliicola TaxID=2592383 RepID=A0A545UCE9_9GAMM|nr:DUF4266 domain-containing protein [Aliikangiella coralliicola]TQV87137.1 DUF4266 domain-containing protein [Aliikangiella coralliicola]
MYHRVRLILSISLLGMFLSGCQVVQPWERGKLARPEMAWSNDVLEGRLESHIYWSKEASSGGSSAAGGGCGCN